MTPQAVFPSTALRSSQAEVKRQACAGPVLVADTAGKSYLLCSEDAFAQDEREGAEQAAYERRVGEAIRRGREGIARGEYVVGAEAAIAAAEELRATHG